MISLEMCQKWGKKNIQLNIQLEFVCQVELYVVNRQRHVILWVIEFLLDQRKDCGDHVSGENLAHDSKSHAHLDEVCALEILAGKKNREHISTILLDTEK